jgi:membrane-associated phospholipid phosphatase
MKKERYAQFYEKITVKLRNRPHLIKAIAWTDRVLVYGFVATYVFYLGFTLFSCPFDLLLWANKMGLPALCFGVVTLLRLLIKRPRPYEKAGAGIDAINKKDSVGNSMPSRHVASAFVIAMVFLAESTLFGIIALCVSVLIAALRVLEGVHYPSDALIGALLGIAFGAVGLLF